MMKFKGHRIEWLQRKAPLRESNLSWPLIWILAEVVIFFTRLSIAHEKNLPIPIDIFCLLLVAAVYFFFERKQ